MESREYAGAAAPSMLPWNIGVTSAKCTTESSEVSNETCLAHCFNNQESCAACVPFEACFISASDLVLISLSA